MAAHLSAYCVSLRLSRARGGLAGRAGGALRDGVRQRLAASASNRAATAAAPGRRTHRRAHSVGDIEESAAWARGSSHGQVLERRARRALCRDVDALANWAIGVALRGGHRGGRCERGKQGKKQLHDPLAPLTTRAPHLPTPAARQTQKRAAHPRADMGHRRAVLRAERNWRAPACAALVFRWRRPVSAL